MVNENSAIQIDEFDLSPQLCSLPDKTVDLDLEAEGRGYSSFSYNSKDIICFTHYLFIYLFICVCYKL